MAFPTSMGLYRPGTKTLTGIELVVYPSTNPNLSIEIQRATAASAASSLWRGELLPPSQMPEMRWIMYAPLSTRSFYFRAFHPAQPGYSAGPFTPTVSAKPVSLETRPYVHQPMMTYAGNVEIPSGSDVFVSSAKTLKVGQQQSTGAQTRFMRIPAMSFRERNSTQVYAFSGDTILQPSNANTQVFTAALTLPRNIILRRLRSKLFRASTGDSVRMNLQYGSSVGTVTTLLATSHTASTGWATVVSSTLAHAVTSTERSYSLRCELNAAVAGADVGMLWGEVELTVSDYAQAL